jgi:hypothetical protein
MTPCVLPASAPPPVRLHNLDDRGRAKAERMRGAGSAVHLAGVRLPGRVMCTKGRPVEILAKAAPAPRRPRPSWPG